ncbi:MAG: KamA family radical SAM protein [Candidatus Eisenbacteria sp.]|nr:KamA family radical SAM protein [Candidatus Eisenbacteria bacterium]
MDKKRFNAEYLASQAPRLFAAAREKRPVPELRRQLIAAVLAKRDYALDNYDRKGQGLAIRIRDCARTLVTMFHRRSERLAEFSLTRAIRDLAQGRVRPDLSPAFYADLIHIIWGLAGRVRFESPADQAMRPSEKRGREAAIERSGQLDQLWQMLEAGIARFPTGLDAEVVRGRRQRRRHILEVMGGSEEDWNNWRWQVRHVIRNEKQLRRILRLTPEEEEGIRAAKANRVPFGITPYYASLMDETPTDHDRSVRYQVIPPDRYVQGVCRLRRSDPAVLDFMREEDTSPIDLITRRYPSICILKPISTCPQICVYCQRNWEIEDVLTPGALAPREKLDAALDWIECHSGIREVLVTGGDPFVMGRERLRYIMQRLARISSVERIRIGTRTLVTMPMRITDELAAMLGRHCEPGHREIAVVTHCQHPYEVTPEVVEAVDKLRARRIPVYNQLVYTFFVSRRFEAVALRRALRLAGIDPYYTFSMKGKEEMEDYRVPIARLMQEQKEEARLLPGLARTDEAVYNIPGRGKNYLRAQQHRELISILPNGARVYEFHPWEKNITSGIRTYVGRDVPILEYLERLDRIGEGPNDYSSIWYYF